MKRPRILLVEDEPLISVFFAELLEEMGNDVCSIETTEASAVAAAEFFKPDLLIVDVHLREGNGLSAVTAILKNGFIPHIFTTGDRTVSGEVSQGAVVLQKPFLDVALGRAISKALATAGTQSR
jgi:CheY-like chemotaxis protein